MYVHWQIIDERVTYYITSAYTGVYNHFSKPKNSMSAGKASGMNTDNKNRLHSFVINLGIH